MANTLEMSLDDIIKSNKYGPMSLNNIVKFNKRGQQNPRIANFRNTRYRWTSGDIQRGCEQGRMPGISAKRYLNKTWKPNTFEQRRFPNTAPTRTTMGSAKLVVSNLHIQVSDADIQDLFAEFGPLKSGAVRCNGSGRSLGTADVIFERQHDAIEAMKRYNGVTLDGQAMHIHLAPLDIRDQKFGGEKKKFENRSLVKQERHNSNSGDGNSRPRKRVTATELDAELDAYAKERSNLSS